MDSLYSEILLDLYRNPLNKLRLADFDYHNKQDNPLCGDTVEIFIKYGSNNRVLTATWQGSGCAVSQTAASILTEQMKDKTKSDLKKIKPATILKLLGLTKLNPTRMRCALLSLECLKKIT